MRRSALVFLLLALVAAAVGFGGIAQEFAPVARTLFNVFLAAAVVAYLASRSQVWALPRERRQKSH
ncbi:MAG TPA: DUF1328 family protein [Steroidobacteraceae bacterium]|nr:DUF1328 family protein [Steroidobacteraceae bacterium]